MRMAESSSPEYESLATMEQAQQVALPEIPGIGLSEIYEAMQLNPYTWRKGPVLDANGRMVMDFSGFSSRTISAPEIERYQMMDASHYSKITMPTFYIN